MRLNMRLPWIFVIVSVLTLATFIIYDVATKPTIVKTIEPPPTAIVAIEKISNEDYKLTKAIVQTIEINERTFKGNHTTWMTKFLEEPLKSHTVHLSERRWLIQGKSNKEKGIRILPGNNVESVTQFSLTIQKLSERQNNNSYLIQTDNIIPDLKEGQIIMTFEGNEISFITDRKIRTKVKYESPVRDMCHIRQTANGFRITNIQATEESRVYLVTFALAFLRQYDNNCFVD